MFRPTPWLVAGLTLTPALAQQAPEKVPTALVQVTATRFAEDPVKVPASVTVITGEELADRGATDLRSALALVAGVTIAPGGDGGPASAVPEFYGLKEADAFLLVVDGVPFGGAFNPAVSTLDLANVDRIEIQKGSAPVMFGATSFVGVIHVIHRTPGETVNGARLSLGSHGSWGEAATLKLPALGGFASSLSAGVEKQGFDDPRTEFTKGTLLWRNRREIEGGAVHVDVSGAFLDQLPGSPHLREGADLSAAMALDANLNPDGAFMRERRVGVSAGFDLALGRSTWTTTLAVSRSRQNVFRGFLGETEDPAKNAIGFHDRIQTTDLYFDTHLAFEHLPKTKLVVGLDHLHGQGTGEGGDTEYLADLAGGSQPGGTALNPDMNLRIDDRRDFSGLYAFAEFEPLPHLLLEGGFRLNRTTERRSTRFQDLTTPSPAVYEEHSHTTTKGSTSLGATYTPWQQGPDHLAFFANAKDTFKPAAIDFGVDSTAEILEPETARTLEAGVKGALLEGRLTFEVAAFRMRFDNLITSQGGVLRNSGQERFQGVEGEVAFRITRDFSLRGSYGYHDARFTDFVMDFGGTPTQLGGKRFEMSAYHQGAVGLLYAPQGGFLASVDANYLGPVYLNKRNTAPAGGFTTWSASLGWRAHTWEARLTGRNLSDTRSPVAESEMGDGQYYRMPGRHIAASVAFRF
ncbi:MAG TPA: TonB-dependent receptor [Holophagaceae bacterium]|nr:TonB-dependent receptor [Holophagaceae bacterium]